MKKEIRIRRRYIKTLDGVAVVSTHPVEDEYFRLVEYTEAGERSVLYWTEEEINRCKSIEGNEFYKVREMYVKDRKL